MNRSKSGHREDLGIYVRSKWEANVARLFNHSIYKKWINHWQYEPDTFEFPIKRGTRFYTPDFKVVWANGNCSYIEVKGRMDSRSQTQLSRMEKYYPDVIINIIGQREYTELSKLYQDQIEHWEK